MVKMKIPTSLYFLVISLLCSCGINAATLLVTNLLDDGSAGSLRETIATASNGDTIQFSVDGTITLNETLGALIIDKQLTIDGQNKILIDGADMIAICFYLTEAAANNTVITKITIQNFNGHGSTEHPAYGIFCNHNITNCSIVSVTIKHIHSGCAQEAAGIFCDHIGAGKISSNRIELISSENTDGSSGAVFGIKTGSPLEVFSNTISNLVSGDANDNSGDVIGIDATEINPYNNTITNLASGAAGNNSGCVIGARATCFINSINNTINNLSSGSAAHDSGLVQGICAQTIINDCSHNTLSHATSGHAHNNSQSVIGIMIQESIRGECLNNTIQHISSGPARNSSGSVIGIFGDTFTRNCSSNTIQYLTIGNADHAEESVVGIFVNSLHGNGINNLITDITVTNAIATKRAGGIKCSFVAGSSLLSYNTIDRVTGGQNGYTFGIEIEEGNTLTIRNNTIRSIGDVNTQSHGIILGTTETFVTNSHINTNTIRSIIGNQQRFGVSIYGTGSTGNDLLKNSIFDISGKVINIVDNGAPVDATVTLETVDCNDQSIYIHGTLKPESGCENSEFLLQFFASENDIQPQAMTFIGETTITASGETPFTVEIIIETPIEANHYITATATAQPTKKGEHNNTSEVSNVVPGCGNRELSYNQICSSIK